MSESKKTFRLTALSVALMAAFGAVQADEAEVNALTKPESSVSLGLGNWSNDRHQQGIYDSMRDSNAYGLIDADIVKRDEATGTWMTFRATNLGLDSREVKGEYLRQGNFGLSLDYNRISRDNPYAINTGLQGIGSTTQIVSSTAPKGTVSLNTERDIIGLGLYKNIAPGLDFKLSFKNEEKTGNRQWGRGSATEFTVEPVDSTTRQLKGILSYSSKTLQLSGGYSGSWYDTKNTMVTVFTNTVGTSPTYLSLPLDNQAHQLFLNGGYTFTPTTRATLKMSYTRATQNEHLPTQDVVGLSLPGSPSSLDGEINTTMVQLGLTSRPIKDLSLVASLHYHNVDDATPANRFVQTNAACGSGQCVDNTPMSYKTVTGKLEGTYRLPDGYSLTAGVDERRQDRIVPVSNANGTGGTDTQRVVPMRTDVDETTWRLGLRRSLSDVLNGSVTYLNSHRTGSSYVFAAGPGNGSANGFTDISNLINPINIADRERNKIRLALDWSPAQNLSFQFNVEEGRDKYDHDTARPFGLDEGKVRLYGVDSSYTLNDKWKLNAWYSYDRNEATQDNARASNGGGLAAIKDYDLKDTGNSLGLGLRAELSERINLGADLQWSRNVSQYQQSVSAATTQASFAEGTPDIASKLTKLSIFSTYALDKQSDLRLDLIHERWETNDWTWTYANGTDYAYSTANDGTTISANPRQNSTFVGIRYIYKFQ